MSNRFLKYAVLSWALAGPTVALPSPELDDATARFASFYSDELYSRALVAANQAVQYARRDYGDSSLETALALANLATAQAALEDYAAAVENYELCIKLIEDDEDILSPRLVNPLMGLGAAHNALGRYDRAFAAYERALRVNHVDEGLFNENQMAIRDGLTESLIGLEDLDDAEFQQEVQVTILRQEFPDDLDRILPAVYKLAGWYRRTSQPEKEVYQYQTAMRLIQEQEDGPDPAQIDALRGLAEVYQINGMPGDAIRQLKRAYRINAESAQPDIVLAADIQIQIGDYYNLFGSRRDARNYYEAAWNTLDSAGGQAAALAVYFGEPVAIEPIDLPRVYPASSSNESLFRREPEVFREGFVSIEFDIDDDGRVRDPRIIESEPPDLIDRRASTVISRVNYRPRLVDGTPVATTGNRVNHRFYYLVEPVDDTGGSSSDSGRLERPGSSDEELDED